jgi:lysozyme
MIRAHEACRLKAYRCAGGAWTIGFGSTKGVRPLMEITQEEADERLTRDLRTAEDAVNRLVHVPLTQNAFDALCSFTFNVGSSALADSTLLRLLNERDYAGAAKEFDKWVFAKGKRLKGLVLRREAERRLFERADHA